VPMQRVYSSVYLLNLITRRFVIAHIYLCLIVLGAFAKFLKATISFAMSVRVPVCPSVRPHEKNSAPTGPIFINCNIMGFF
jgi:hypothetical protein